MDASDLLDTVRADNETALSRLGSSKSLYAATGGEMERDAVLRAAADAEYVAARTFEAWADDEANDEAREAFQAVASEEDAHYETVAGELADDEPGDDAASGDDPGTGDDPGAMQQYLRGLDSTVERAGGLLGRLLATGKSKEQLTGFFVGQADPQTAQTFRDLKSDLDGQRERTLDLLDAVCESDADWDAAKAAADGAIQAAYEEYVEQLEAMGVNPKPVC